MMVTVLVLATSVLLSLFGICAYGVLAGRQAELWRGARDLILNLRKNPQSSIPVCPFCGSPAGGPFCANCGSLQQRRQ